MRFQGSGSGDTEPPILTIDAQPNGQNGWFTSDPVTVTAHAKDAAIASLVCVAGEQESTAQSGEESETLDLEVPIVGEGQHQIVCVAADASGNSTERSASVPIDVTSPPAVVLSPDREPDYVSTTSWYRDQVTVPLRSRKTHCSPTEVPGSGLDPASLPESIVFSTSGSHEAIVTVLDLAGNISPESVLWLNVDATVPETILDCPESVLLGAPSSAAWSDSDGESGLQGPATGTQESDTSTVGTHVSSHEAVDLVGHAASSTCQYQVVYPFALGSKVKPPPQLNKRAGKNRRCTWNSALAVIGASSSSAPGSPPSSRSIAAVENRSVPRRPRSRRTRSTTTRTKGCTTTSGTWARWETTAAWPCCSDSTTVRRTRPGWPFSHVARRGRVLRRDFPVRPRPALPRISRRTEFPEGCRSG